MNGNKPAQDGALNDRDIDPDALRVVRKLVQAGYEAFLVGGCVRDLLLRRKPKDFDVATSATPEQIRRVFKNSRIIGRRFKLAHVFFGSKIIETSTFRAAPALPTKGEELLITHDNEWGSVEDDAMRRDFTINGLFYDVGPGEVVDYVGGISDLKRGIIRTIGDAETRYREDPVRMIRAIKFAARLDFTIDNEGWGSLLEVASDITKCSRARLLEEIYKLLRGGASRRSFELLLETKLLEQIWPSYLKAFEPFGGLKRTSLRPPQQEGPLRDPSVLLWRYLDALDTYVLETGQIPGNGVVQALLFAPLLEEALREASRSELDSVIEDVMSGPCAGLGVARRDRELARQIFMAHRRMTQPGRNAGKGPNANRRGGNRASLVQRQYFHDALLFLSFHVSASNADGGELEHWRDLARQIRVAAPPSDRRRPRRKSRSRRRSRDKDRHKDRSKGSTTREPRSSSDNGSDHA